MIPGAQATIRKLSPNFDIQYIERGVQSHSQTVVYVQCEKQNQAESQMFSDLCAHPFAQMAKKLNFLDSAIASFDSKQLTEHDMTAEMSSGKLIGMVMFSYISSDR